MDLFACSCFQHLYIFHLETKSLITAIKIAINEERYIKKIFINPQSQSLFSIFVKVHKEDKIIAVDFEQCGSQLGT